MRTVWLYGMCIILGTYKDIHFGSLWEISFSHCEWLNLVDEVGSGYISFLNNFPAFWPSPALPRRHQKILLPRLPTVMKHRDNKPKGRWVG